MIPAASLFSRILFLLCNFIIHFPYQRCDRTQRARAAPPRRKFTKADGEREGHGERDRCYCALIEIRARSSPQSRYNIGRNVTSSLTENPIWINYRTPRGNIMFGSIFFFFYNQLFFHSFARICVFARDPISLPRRSEVLYGFITRKKKYRVSLKKKKKKGEKCRRGSASVNGFFAHARDEGREERWAGEGEGSVPACGNAIRNPGRVVLFVITGPRCSWLPGYRRGGISSIIEREERRISSGRLPGSERTAGIKSWAKWAAQWLTLAALYPNVRFSARSRSISYRLYRNEIKTLPEWEYCYFRFGGDFFLLKDFHCYLLIKSVKTVILTRNNTEDELHCRLAKFFESSDWSDACVSSPSSNKTSGTRKSSEWDT